MEALERFRLLNPKTFRQSCSGWTRSVRPSNIIVVAPYNAQVNALTEAFPDTRVGTVHKFQGQEAPVPSYPLTVSSAQERAIVESW